MMIALGHTDHKLQHPYITRRDLNFQDLVVHKLAGPSGRLQVFDGVSGSRNSCGYHENNG